MKFSKLGSFKISRLGLGTVQFGMDYGFTKKKSQKEVNAILMRCLKHGVNFLDTAREYGDSEAKIGNFFKNSGSKSRFVVATKLKKFRRADMESAQKAADSIRNSIESSKRALNVMRLDMLQLHQTDAWVANNTHFWEALIRIYKQDKSFKYFGVSVYDVNNAKSLIAKRGKIIRFVQLPYNILDRRFESLLGYFKRRRVAVIGRSVFLKGVLAESVERWPKELKKLKPFRKKIDAIAGRTGLTAADIALLFALQKRRIDSVIVGVDNAQELDRNVKTERKASLIRLPGQLRKMCGPASGTDPRRWKQL